jgi:outer membrane protein TolC
MRKKALCLILAVLPALLSAEARDLTVQEAISLGKAHNLNLKVQDITVAQADRAKNDRWNVFVPDVNAQVILNHSNVATTGTAVVANPYDTASTPYGTVYNSVFSSDYDVNQYTLIGNLSAQLVLTPALANGIKALDINLRTEQLNREKDEKDLEMSIEKNYFQLVQMKKSVELLEKNIVTTTQRYNDMQAMYRNGLITELDLLQVQSGLASLKPSLTSLKNGYEQLHMAFCMDLGLPLNQELNLTEEISVNARAFDADEMVNRYLADNLDVKAMALGKDSAENGRKAQINQSLPSLILGWNYQPMIMAPFESGSWENEPFKDNDGGAFSLTLNIPLDDWLPHSGAANKVKEMEDTLAGLEYQEKLLYQGTEMRIRSSVMSLEASRENLAAMEENADLARKTYDMSWEQYRNGQMTATDLSQSENDLLQAESDLLGEKFKYITALLDLEYLINRDLDGE